jgi:hypothetical protein
MERIGHLPTSVAPAASRDIGFYSLMGSWQDAVEVDVLGRLRRSERVAQAFRPAEWQRSEGRL